MLNLQSKLGPILCSAARGTDLRNFFGSGTDLRQFSGRGTRKCATRFVRRATRNFCADFVGVPMCAWFSWRRTEVRKFSGRGTKVRTFFRSGTRAMVFFAVGVLIYEKPSKKASHHGNPIGNIHHRKYPPGNNQCARFFRDVRVLNTRACSPIPPVHFIIRSSRRCRHA